MQQHSSAADAAVAGSPIYILLYIYTAAVVHGEPKGEDLKNRHPPPHIMHSKPHQQHTASCFGFNGYSGRLVGNLTLVGHTLPNNLL